MIDSATKLFSQVSSAAGAVEGGIKKGWEDVRSIERSIELAIHRRIRDFQKKWILRWIAFVAASMGVAAYAISGYFALRTVTTPPMAAFLLGSVLALLSLVFLTLSQKRFRKRSF